MEYLILNFLQKHHQTCFCGNQTNKVILNTGEKYIYYDPLRELAGGYSDNDHPWNGGYETMNIASSNSHSRMFPAALFMTEGQCPFDRGVGQFGWKVAKEKCYCGRRDWGNWVEQVGNEVEEDGEDEEWVRTWRLVVKDWGMKGWELRGWWWRVGNLEVGGEGLGT